MLIKVAAYTTAMEARRARPRLEADAIAARMAHEFAKSNAILCSGRSAVPACRYAIDAAARGLMQTGRLAHGT